MSLVDRMLAKSNEQVPVDLSRLFTEALSHNEFEELLKKIDSGIPELDRDIAAGLEDLKRAYNDHQNDAFYGRLWRQGASIGINSAVDVGFSMATDGLSGGRATLIKFGANVGKAIIERTTEAWLDTYNEDVRRRGADLISSHLEAVRAANNLTWEDINEMSIAEAREIVLDTDAGIINNQSLDFLEPQDREIAAIEMTKLLEDALTREIAIDRLAIEGNFQNIEGVKASIEVLRSYQSNINELQKAAFDDIGDELALLRDDMSAFETSLVNVSERTDLNSEDIQFLAEVMYSQGDLTTKIQLLEAGKTHLTGVAKEKEEAKLRAAHARQTLKKKVDGYLDKAESVTTIMSNLGVDLPPNLQQVASVGKTAMAAYSAYLGGNPLAAAATVSSLFGGGGATGDPAAQKRHDAVMRKLDLLNERVEAVLDNQKAILRGIAEILDALIKIDEKLEDMHAEEIDRIHQNLGATLYNRISNVQVSTRKLESLIGFAKDFAEKDGESGLSLAELNDWFRDEGYRFQLGKDDLSSVMNADGASDGGADPYLRLIEYEGEMHSSDPLRRNPITELLSGFEATLNYSNLVGTPAECHDVLAPATRITDLNKRSSLVGLGDRRRIDLTSPMMAKFISSFHLDRVARSLMHVHKLFLLQKGESKYECLSVEEFFLKDVHSGQGSSLLRAALELTNHSLAQESLLAGDFLLLSAYEDLVNQESDANSKRRQAAIKMLRKNRLLRSNFAKFFLDKQLSSPRVVGTNSVQRVEPYEFFPFLNDTSDFSADPSQVSGLRSFFDGHLHNSLKIETSNDQRFWVVNFEEGDEAVSVRLPNAPEFQDGNLNYRKDMRRLALLKAELVAANALYLGEEAIVDDSVVNRVRFQV